MAELVDALVSNTSEKSCRFDSGSGYPQSRLIMNNFKRFFYAQNLEGTLWGTVVILVVLFGRFRFIALRGRAIASSPHFAALHSGLSALSQTRV